MKDFKKIQKNANLSTKYYSKYDCNLKRYKVLSIIEYKLIWEEVENLLTKRICLMRKRKITGLISNQIVKNIVVLNYYVISNF